MVWNTINLSFTPIISSIATPSPMDRSKGKGVNIKQNKLTLKALQEKLDKLEKSSNINIEVRKGGMPSLFLPLSSYGKD